MENIIEIKSCNVNSLGKYLLMFSKEESFLVKNTQTGKNQAHIVSFLEFEPKDLIEQCCLVRQEINYFYLKSSYFGASALNALLRGSILTVEQIASEKELKTVIKNIEILDPKSLERYSKFRNEYLNIIKLSIQDIEGVDIKESADKYFDGNGVNKDINEAIRLYTKSAEKGNAESQLKLYEIYINDHYASEDITKAFFWLENASAQGLASAKEVLATYYFEGDPGIERDVKKAVELFTQASIQGQSEAQSYLGFIYNFGIGVETNIWNAIKWYELSQKDGEDSETQYKLGQCYEQGDIDHGLEPDIDKALKCYEFSAKYHNADALRSLGMYYYSGAGKNEDITKAIDYFIRSIENEGNSIVYAMLGYIYCNIEAVRDYSKALTYLKPVAQENILDSQINLAYCYFYGYKDKLEAHYWFLKSAQNGNPMAANALNFLDFR